MSPFILGKFCMNIIDLESHSGVSKQDKRNTLYFFVKDDVRWPENIMSEIMLYFREHATLN